MIPLRALVSQFLGLALLLMVAACGGPGPAVGNLPSVGAATTTNADGTTATRLERQTYRLGAGDRIKVIVFRHEDLSNEFQLDGNGNLAMSLIGEVDAEGLSARELEDQIELRLSDGFLIDPQVSIEVLTYRPFYILGEVAAPGQYEYVSGMSVINAVALAGGFTYRAAEDSGTIQRGGSNTPPVLVTGDTEVVPGDIVRVPERFF